MGAPVLTIDHNAAQRRDALVGRLVGSVLGAVDLDLQSGFADEYTADGATYLTTDGLISIDDAADEAVYGRRVSIEFLHKLRDDDTGALSFTGGKLDITDKRLISSTNAVTPSSRRSGVGTGIAP